MHTVAFDAAGRLHVFDEQAARVVVVDVRGGFVHEFGQEGEGPGDFRDAVAMAVLTDGRVVVGDTGHRGYSVFDASGVFLHMVRMGGDPGPRLVGTLVGQRDKRVVSQAAFGTEGTGIKVLNNAPLVPTHTPHRAHRPCRSEEITSTTSRKHGFQRWQIHGTGMVSTGVEFKIPRPLAFGVGLHWGCYRTGA